MRECKRSKRFRAVCLGTAAVSCLALLLLFCFAGTAASRPGVPDDFVQLQGGKFLMGDPSLKGDFSERPSHWVNLSPFCIEAHEVTVSQFADFLNAKGLKPAPDEAGTDRDLMSMNLLSSYLMDSLKEQGLVYEDGRFIAVERQDVPVMVSWYWARAYCSFKGGRLPTEAEFEYASRAGDNGACAPHDQFDASRKSLEVPGGGWRAYLPVLEDVGTHKPNAWGIYDMIGNAPEWCSDWDGAYHYNFEYWRRQTKRGTYWGNHMRGFYNSALPHMENPYYRECMDRFPEGVPDPCNASCPKDPMDRVKVIRGGWPWATQGRYSARNRIMPFESAGFRCVIPAKEGG